MKMAWDWVKGYPIFAYMQYISRGIWAVKVVKGVKGNQNIGDNSPNATAWFCFKTEDKISRCDVFQEVLKRSKWKLKAQERREGDGKRI